MSFSWSAGDIVAALKLLHQIGSAIRDSGGDFQDTLSFLETLSRTLQHLNASQATPLDPELADNLREQCDHIRAPLAAFLDDVGGKFGPALSVNSRRTRISGAPRMIQWALSTSKKTKRLQDRIAVPMASVGLILGQQIVQTTLKMPDILLDRISHTIDAAIDTRIVPETKLVDFKIEALSTAQVSSVDTITRTVQEIGRTTTEAIHRKMLEDRAQSLSLRKKLERVGTSISNIENSLLGLSTTRLKLDRSVPKPGIEQAAQNILGSIWLLLSSLQLLIRELVILLAPYLIAFYRPTVQALLQCSDHFMFEDAIGRTKKLLCTQFQHWDIFYDFLINSFQDTPGLLLVRTERFRVMNGYNGYLISRDAWPAVIQPKSKIVMAMVLDSMVMEHGSCVDPSCSGRVSLTTAKPTCICPVCGKYISVLKETTKRSENDQNPDVILSRAGPELKLKAEQRNNETPLSTLDKDIAVFKRVSFTLKAGSSQTTAGESTMPGSNDKERERSRLNEYFVPKDGIDREVITADICRYLGNEALVRPGKYENPQTRQIQLGYFITAYRNLTRAMIADIKADSERWEAERRATASRGQHSYGISSQDPGGIARKPNTPIVEYRASTTYKSRQYYRPSEAALAAAPLGYQQPKDPYYGRD